MVQGGRVQIVKRELVSEKNCTVQNVLSYVHAIKIIQKCATRGLANASVTMVSLAATATDHALFTLMVLSVAKCVLVKMMPFVIRQMDLAFVLLDGLDRTAPHPAKKGNMVRTASMIATVKTVPNVILLMENVIVLLDGMEYFVTLNVLPDNLEKIVKKNVTA